MGLVREVAVTSLCVLLSCVHLVELRSGATRDVRATQPQLEVTDFHVKCTVVSRYARTTVISTVFNRLPQATDATFEVDLPSTAFISNFTITSGGKEYVSQVKQKQVAKQIYDEAKKKGQTAGLVASRKEVPGKFSIDVSVPPGERLSFELSFEQLLVRRLGRYELALGLRPTQPVPNLSVEVDITERTGISFVHVLPLRTGQHLSNTLGEETGSPSNTVLEQWSQQRAQVLFRPTLEQQTSSSPKGLDADFVIEYDVILTDLIGDVQVYDGYFVHYFAPRQLPVVPKEVIFVIDVSGSMSRSKLEQTKEAMDAILGDLRSHDHFNIITFSTDVHLWKQNATVPATADNIQQARGFAKKIRARGSTDINAALVKAGTLLRNSSSQWGVRGVPMVIFLTDGSANHGVTNKETMRGNVREALGSAALFGLAFGQDADYGLLRQLSLDNRGVARRVYSDSKATLQLKGFYDEVANPLLSDVQLSYSDDQAFDVTRSLFPNYFQGSELVVAGRVHPGSRGLGVSLNAFDTKKHLTVENNIPLSGVSSPDQKIFSGFVRRLWAYFTIKELLLTAENASDPSTRALLEQNATSLSLKYNFVTPVTSLVVVKPDLEEVPGEEKPSPDSTDKKAKSVPQRGHSRKAFASSADGDPHFQVHLPKLGQNLCFTIDGHARDVLRLVEDAENGITVDGRLMWAPPEVGHEDQERTYFDQIVVTKGGPEPVVVTVTLDSVNISRPGRPDRTLPTGAVGSVRGPDLQVSIDEQFRCWVDLGQGVSFLVLFHHYKHPDYMQLDHLGFYIAKGDGFSVGTQGLLGQFQHADINIRSMDTVRRHSGQRITTETGSLGRGLRHSGQRITEETGSLGRGLRHRGHRITEETGGIGTALRHRGQRRDSATDTSALTFGTLQRGTAQVPVTQRMKMMKDTVRKRHAGLCWEVGKDDVEKILAQPYRAYIRDTDGLPH